MLAIPLHTLLLSIVQRMLFSLVYRSFPSLRLSLSLMKSLFTSLADLSQSRMPFELVVGNRISMSPLDLVLCLLNSITSGIEDFFLLLALLSSPLKNISCTFVKIFPHRPVSLSIANLLTVHSMTFMKR